MKKPTHPASEPPASEPTAPEPTATLPMVAGNTWANQASTRLGGSHVVDESHLTAPAAAAADAASPVNPPSEET